MFCFFHLVLMSTHLTFTCLQYLIMLGCRPHFILFSVETFLEISDLFLMESILLVCNLFYTPWFWATIGLLLFSLTFAYFIMRWNRFLWPALVPHFYWNTLPCISAFLVWRVECNFFCFWFCDGYPDHKNKCACSSALFHILHIKTLYWHSWWKGIQNDLKEN